jgi:RNA polymerase sigma-70 factor (ECF subfamily)
MSVWPARSDLAQAHEPAAGMTASRPAAAERDDAALMALVASGDGVAFHALVERHLGRTLSLAQAVVGSAADADEIAQEAFLRLWTNAARWDPDRSLLTTWLHRIVVNLCLDRLRKRRSGTLDDEALAVADPADSAFDQLAQRESQARVRAALARMPPRQRLALVLFYFEDLDLRAGAAAMALSPAAFEALLRRARRALKDLLATLTDNEMPPNEISPNEISPNEISP